MLHGADGALLPHDDARAEVRATAQRAATLGVQTLLLWVGTRRPARALLEVAAEQSAALLVFAPDRRAIGTRRFRRTARAVRKQGRLPRLGHARRSRRDRARLSLSRSRPSRS